MKNTYSTAKVANGIGLAGARELAAVREEREAVPERLDVVDGARRAALVLREARGVRRGVLQG